MRLYTSSTLTRSLMITQSSLSSSYLLNFKPLSPVTLSIAVLYLSTKFIISYVEFQRVTTSRGMRHSLRLSSRQVRRQAGSAIVVEWMMAKAFQKMLQEFRLTRTILSVDANNASTNGMQTTKLDELDNSFNKENCICCFNHTMQLSAKALLKPSTSVLSGKETNDNEMAITEIEDRKSVV